ncbi:MAG TPA: LytTR family DNA-binding domain-containing protein [Burkholderiales bacterium]|nr:LytTR family DNA-binding domain-containing protein [Burkholderiales bacterium]
MSNRGAALRVVVADDEAPARNRIRDVLQDCAHSVPIEVVGEASDGRALLELLDSIACDVVLLDIRMPEMDGIEAAQHMQKLARRPAIVFTTAYDAYAVQAFELHAVDYLVKPIRLHRLEEALSRVQSIAAPSPDMLAQLHPGPRKHLSVQERGKLILVPVDQILFLRAEQKYVTLRTAQREHILEESLTRLEEEFAQCFVRIHRSCLVGREHVERFERGDEGADSGWWVVVRGLEERLPVSRRQQHVIKEFARS